LTPSFFLRFLGQFFLYLLVVGIFASYPLYEYGTPVIWRGLLANFLLFIAITIVTFVIIMRKGPQASGIINNFLASTGLKMIIALVYFVLLLKKFRGNEIEFAVTFFVAYLVCTVFEVIYLLRNLRRN
jgi:heme/copper-type cytochrome/quinol oxidase subunit 4